MVQDPSRPVASARSEEIEVSLVDILAPLRRHWRLVVSGIGGCWAMLLLVVVLAPPRFRCEAALALPTLSPLPSASAGRTGEELAENEAPGEEGTATGLPYAFYRKIERSLQDGAVLRSALGRTLEPAALEHLRRALTEHVSPVASGSGDDRGKDVVGAVGLSYESYSADRSRGVVSALASLLRGKVIAGLARERIAWEARVSDRARLRLIRRKEELHEVNRSLQGLAADLERLTREMPEGRAAAPREIVDAREGGHLYLPPWLQLVGVRARYATNEQTIRTCDQALAREARRSSFLRRLDGRLDDTEASVPSNVPQVLADQLKALGHEAGSSGTASDSLEAEMQVLGDELSVLAAQTRFIQRPTVARVSRARWTAALASLAVVLFVAAAFVADLWKRSEVQRTGDAAAAPRPAP